MSTDNGGKTWICKRCGQEQTEPKGNNSQKYCSPCKILAHKEQMAAWQKAHLGENRAARPDLVMERKRAKQAAP